MQTRITTACQRWVKPGAYMFRAVPNADGHYDTVRFNWEMVHVATGEVVSVGFDFMTLTDDGLIKTDHQFIDG